MKRALNFLLALVLLLSAIPAFAQTTADTGIWEKRAFVDDFGDPTNEYYYTAKVSGTFSNSATTNSDLTATIIIDQSNEDASVSLILYEYGEYQVKNPFSSSRQYEVKIKDGFGTVSTYEGYMYSDRLYIYDSEYLSWSPVESIFARGGKVQFVIQSKDEKLTKYNLIIPDATGYANLFPITNVGSFSEGKAHYVRGGTYYGYINTDGSEALPCRYTAAGKFSQGLAYTKIADHDDGYDYAFINPQGEIMFTVNSNGISAFNEDGIAYCYDRTGAMKAINTSGQLISDLRCSNYTEGIAPVLGENGLWGYMDLTGNIIIPCEYTNMTYFADGLALVQRNNEPVWHCIDPHGTVLFSYECNAAGTFSDGLAMVLVGDPAAPTFGFIDQEGTLVIPAIYQNALDFSNGRAPVSNGEKFAVIDKAGNAITDYIFSSVHGSYFDGMLAVQDGNGKWGFIDINGVQTVPFQYDTVNVFVDGMARVQKNHKFGFIDRNGTAIVPCEYDSAAYGEGYFTLLKDGEITVVDRAELQPNYIESEAAYQDALTKQLEDEDAKYAEAREAQKMLVEYTDKDTVKAVQAALNEAGFPCGTPDGAAGKKTIAALTDYQTANGLTVTGTITHETLISLGLAE